MYSVIIGLIVVSAILLVLIVLAQNSKGGGLSSQFGGSGNQIMGVKRTTDILEKLTWGFAIAIIVFSMATTVLLKNTEAAAEDGFNSPNLNKAQQQQSVLPALSEPATTEEGTLEEGAILETDSAQ